MTKVQISLVLLATACCLMMARTNAGMYHIVGGSLGWTVPPNSTFYEEWAKPRVIAVQDHLLFPFTGFHNVLEVAREDFDKCKQDHVIKLYPFGPVILNFTEPGDHYYYSAVGTQCEAGQKLHVTVVAGKGSSGRIFTTESIGDLSPAPPPAPNSGPAGPTGGLAMMIGGLISLVAWQFV